MFVKFCPVNFQSRCADIMSAELLEWFVYPRFSPVFGGYVPINHINACMTYLFFFYISHVLSDKNIHALVNFQSRCADIVSAELLERFVYPGVSPVCGSYVPINNVDGNIEPSTVHSG